MLGVNETQADHDMEILRQELQSILTVLRAHHIDYTILHPFPERGFLQPTDFDIYIEKDRFHEVELWLRGRGWKEEPNIYFRCIRRYFSKIIVGYKLKLDITLEYAVFDRKNRFVYTGDVRKQADKDGYLYLDDYAGFFLILKKALVRNYILPSKLDELKTIASRCSAIRAMLPWAATVTVKTCVANRAQIDKDFTSVRSGNFSVREWIKAYRRRLCLARGILNIAFVGMDGAGKGTYLEMVRKELERRNIYFRQVYLGYSSYVLSPLRFVARLNEKPHSPFAQKFLTAVYLLLLPFDFLIRRGNGRYEILLTDRHPLFEPVFSKGVLRVYDRLILAICPAPDLVIYLGGDSDTLWRRKKESPRDQYLQRKARMESLLRTHSNSYHSASIDTTDNVDLVFREIVKVIEEYAQHHCGD